MYENVMSGMAQNAWNEGVTLATSFAAGGPACGMLGYGTPFAMLERYDATPFATEVYENSLMPRMDPFTPAYVDPGRSKFLEIQKMEWEYQPPKAINHSVKSDFDWFKPTTLIEPILPKSQGRNLVADMMPRGRNELNLGKSNLWEIDSAIENARNRKIDPIPLYKSEPLPEYIKPYEQPFKPWGEPKPLNDYEPLGYYISETRKLLYPEQKPYEPFKLESIKSWEPEQVKQWWEKEPVTLREREPIRLWEPEPLKRYEFEPIKLQAEERNPFFVEKRNTDFGIQPIKIENNLFPKRGGMHDSFNVTSSGDIFNGHTTIELKGGLKARLPWELDPDTSIFKKSPLF
jgi:hypothetical protein